MKRFVCKCCGACCRWGGEVRLESAELVPIANHLGISLNDLIAKYTDLAHDRTGLVAASRPDGSCIFLTEDNKCRINAVKPAQCASFPYDWNVPEAFGVRCKGHWEEQVPENPNISLVHVLGHPDLPLDIEAHPADAQLRNCQAFCQMLAHLGIPFLYYGPPASHVPEGGAFVSTGESPEKWTWNSTWHHQYNKRLSQLLAQNIRRDDPRPQLIASLYGVAQSEIDPQGLPVLEPMAGYGSVWAKYKVFPSYAQQTAIYTKQQDDTWRTRFFDTVIPHFVSPDEFHVSSSPQNYLLYLGRDSMDKGIALAQQCADACCIPLRIEHDGWFGQARADLLANARAVLMPTLYVEPFGLVAIEAQMSGTPVITTDWGAFAETVIHGQTGFRCRTAAEFAAAIRLAPRLDRQQIRDSAIARFSMTILAPFYEKYLLFVWNVHNYGGYYNKDAFRDPTAWLGSNSFPLT